MYSKHDTRSVHALCYVYIMCVHVLNKKRERKKKRTYQEWRDSYREKCRKRGREREREKMYPSKQLDPGSCPSLVSTIRSFVVPLIDTHSSSQFLRTVIFGNLAILFLSRCFSPLLLLVLCILIDFLILEYSFCNVSIASFLFSFFLYLKKNFFFYFHVYILFFDLSIFLFNSLRFLIAKQKTIATTDAVASQNRFNRPDHPYSSGNHSTWMITVDSMRPFHARCRLNILFFFFSFFKNCSRSRYPCAHAYTETSFLSFFFYLCVSIIDDWRCSRRQTVHVERVQSSNDLCLGFRGSFRRSVACYLQRTRRTRKRARFSFWKVRRIFVCNINFNF